MTNAINVLMGDVHQINDQHNTIVVSKYRQDVDCTKQTLLPAGPQVGSYNNGLGIQLGGGTRVQFMMPTGSNSVDINNSYLNYQLRLVLDCSKSVSGSFVTKTDSGNINVPKSTPGVYYLWKGFWWFQPYQLIFPTDNSMMFAGYDTVTGIPVLGYLKDNATAGATRFVTNNAYCSLMSWEPVNNAIPLSSGPLNSTCILYETNCQFSGINETDQRKFLQFLAYQSTLDPKIQDAQNTTWFYGDEPVLVCPFLPYVIDQIPNSPTFGQRVPDGRFCQLTRVTGNQGTVGPYTDGYGITSTTGTKLGSLQDGPLATGAQFDITTGYKMAATYDTITNTYTATSSGITDNPQCTFTNGLNGMQNVVCKQQTTDKDGTQQYLTVNYFNMQIPLRFIHTIFDQDQPLLFTNAVGASLFNIFLILQRQNIYDVFGNSRLFGTVITNPTTSNGTKGLLGFNANPAMFVPQNSKYVNGMTTGISDMFMFLDIKVSNTFTSDLASSSLIMARVKKMQWNNLGGIITADLQERPIMRPLKNMTDVIVLVAPNDENASDNGTNFPINDPRTVTSSSLYLHQHSTMFSENQLLNIVAQNTPDVACNYLYDFNLRVGKSTTYMYQPFGLRQIEDFRHQTLASNNLVCNRNVASMSDMYKYGDNMILQINTEHFSNMYNQEIAFDGCDMTGTQLLVRWSLGTYNPATTTYTQITPATMNGQTPQSGSLALPTNGIQITVLQMAEAWSIINPMSGKWVLTEDISGYQMNGI